MTMTTMKPGTPYPLGATWDGGGTNFALFSEHATAVELCLFDTPDSAREAMRIPMPAQTDLVWHVYIPGIQPGQCYAYRVFGSFDPEAGLRCNPHKLLVDPYAKALTEALRWHDALFGYPIGDPDQDLAIDERDSAPYLPRCVVIDPAFDWGDERAPNIPLHDTIIYELHVKGFTKQHPEIPAPLRGTYAGLGYPPVIDYLQSLGITAVELMPVHHFVDDRHLVEQGLCNYWGYNTLAYFAPHGAYSSSGTLGDQVLEFKAMVKSLHAAGIEIILDVVYNHTAEGSHLGPTLSMRGIDNPVYYRLVDGSPRYYMDYTGTGNSLNVLHPRTLQLITDSLRYWVTEMHVDGFRFDLAATLARGLFEGDRLSSFFDVIHQDPVLSQVKLIAEPWDVGPGGYQVGNFPVLWAEWNGKYRDTVRRFWKGDDAQVGELAYRLSGSSDLYERTGRSPYASINFITAHDGFTLRDLVSYNEKHNEANGEHNFDGERNNNSWNCGAEGPVDDPEVNALRARQQRNMLATLLLSQGLPMLLAGDERNRSQQGNNNAYCQDNASSWLDWKLNDDARTLLDFTRRLIALRKQHPVLRRRTFFQGRGIHGPDVSDIEWYSPEGRQMSDQEWSDGFVRCIGMLLNGQLMDEIDQRGRSLTDDVFLLLLNAHYEPIAFTLPGAAEGPDWRLLLDTTVPELRERERLPVGSPYQLRERSFAVLYQRGHEWAEQHSLTPVQAKATVPPLEVLDAATDLRSRPSTMVTIASFWSPQLNNTRDVLVYVPPSYDDDPRRYPVIYMHDGQHVFNQHNGSRAEGQLFERMERLSRAGLEAIIVGIPNIGERRVDEYSPFVDPRHGGGWGDQYLAFIVDTLKPYIDRAFRTLPDRTHTAIAGADLAGLISLYAFFNRPETFGFVAALRPRLGFAERALLKMLRTAAFVDGKLYLATGPAEGKQGVADMRRLRDLLQRKGYGKGQKLRYEEAADGQHDQPDWSCCLEEWVPFWLEDGPAAS